MRGAWASDRGCCGGAGRAGASQKEPEPTEGQVEITEGSGAGPSQALVYEQRSLSKHEKGIF